MTRAWPHPGAFFVALLATCAQVPWRTDVLYDGGADPVVLAKAALTLTALAIGVLLVHVRGRRFHTPAAPFLWVFCFLGATVIGAAADQRLVPTLVLVVRVLLVLFIVAVLMSTYDAHAVLHAVIVAFGVLVSVATATTLVLGTTGRLHGGLPPLHANELAALTVLCLLWLLARLCRGEGRLSFAVLVPACVAILLFTQSRTSLAAGATAFVVIVLFTTGIRRSVVIVFAWLPLLVFGIFTLTPAANQVITRGEDAQRLTTFADRLYAWQAAIAPGQSPWHQLFGGGLSQKTIQVTGQPWTEQVLDSSWVSALVQAGWIGLGVGLAWVLTTIIRALRSNREWRGLLVAIVVFLSLRGFLESGLFDASSSFIMLSTVAFMTQQSPRALGSSPGAPLSDRTRTPAVSAV